MARLIIVLGFVIVNWHYRDKHYNTLYSEQCLSGASKNSLRVGEILRVEEIHRVGGRGSVSPLLTIGSEGQGNLEDKGSDEKADNIKNGNHTFVALIDIVFIDDTKRTCTGAIIHDNVVVTAAHCFVGKDKFSSSKPEITASFVVIGTKKMFDTGYEQYLPIERIVIHPKYEGWTADVALVFTFAGMTFDKPGTVIPLAGEKTTAHLDANVTVFSWGHARSNNDEENTNAKSEEKQNTAAIVGKRFRNGHDTFTTSPIKRSKKMLLEYKSESSEEHENLEQITLKDDVTEISNISRYLTDPDSDEKIESSINPYVFGTTNDTYESIEKQLKAHQPKTTRKTSTKGFKSAQSQEISQEDNSTTTKKDQKYMLFSFKSNKNWRRSLGPQQNCLLVENFGFVNIRTCRELVEKVLPDKYNISHNDVICYTNLDRCVDENDSGAPAVRQGQLIAITLGGVEFEGDHVTVGMMIACYCSWISDNLPPGSPSLSCCRNCCDVKHKEEKKKIRRSRFRYKI